MFGQSSSHLGLRNALHRKLPILFEGTFEEAKKAALSESKYFVVCIYSIYHEYTEDFFSKVLCKDEILAQLIERTVFLGACVEDEVGFKLANEYDVQTYPYLRVTFKDEVALELGGYMDAKFLLKEWKKCTDVWDAEVAEDIGFRVDQEQRLRSMDEENRVFADLEREDMERLRLFEEQKKEKEQMDALRRSQEEAQAAEQAAREEEEKRQQALQEEIAAKERESSLERQRQLDREKSEAKERLQSEPAQEDGEVVAIRLRFPKGESMTRRFRRVDTIDQLLYFVKCLDLYAIASKVEFWTAYPSAMLQWEAGTTCFSDLHRFGTNIAINVRFVS